MSDNTGLHHSVRRVEADDDYRLTADCNCGWSTTNPRPTVLAAAIVAHLAPHNPAEAMDWTHALVDYQIEDAAHSAGGSR